MNRKITLALIAVMLLGVIGTKATIAVAQADENYTHPFVQVLAERFGLNEDEVEEALDEIKADHFANKEQNHEDMLNQAVEDGLLTEEQKLALQEKRQEMWTARKAEHEQHREEMDTWFEENGIDHEALHEYMGGHKGFGHRFHKL